MHHRLKEILKVVQKCFAQSTGYPGLVDKPSQVCLLVFCAGF